MYGKSEYILKKSLKCTAWCICLCNLLYVVHSNRNIFNYLQPSFSCCMTTVITFHSVELVSKILKVQRNKEYVTLQNCFWKHILLEKLLEKLQIFLHQSIKKNICADVERCSSSAATILHGHFNPYFKSTLGNFKSTTWELLLRDIQIAVTPHFFFSYHFHSTKRNCPGECRQSPLLLISAGLPKGIVPGHRAFTAYNTPGEKMLYNGSLVILLSRQ